MAWLNSGAVLPEAGLFVASGLAGNSPSYVCRGRRPDQTTDTALYSGSSTGPGVCTIVIAGTVLNATSSSIEQLASLPPLPTTNWTATGVTPLNPSPSASPSVSPSPSSSAPPPAPGTVPLYLPPLQPGSTTARGYPGGYVQPIPALAGGTEEDGKRIYACVGTLPNGDVLPGKYSLGTGWSWCDIPHDESEENDMVYSLIRDSPYLVWYAAGPVPLATATPTASPSMGVGATANASASPSPVPVTAPAVTVPPALSALVPGAAPATVGTYKGAASIPCRAWKATSTYSFMGAITYSGPHVGSFGYDTLGRPMCSFGYGNSVTHEAVFDLLYVLPANASLAAVSALVTAVPRPSSSATPSVTPTRSPSSTPATPSVVQWLTPSLASVAGFTPENGGFLQAGTNGMDISRYPYVPKPVYVCRATLPDVGLVPGRFESSAYGSSCTVGYNGSEMAAGAYEVLIRSPWLAWAPPDGSPLPGPSPSPGANATARVFTLPAGAAAVEAGKVGVRIAVVCRAYPVPGVGPLSGYMLMKLMGERPNAAGQWPEGVNMCTIAYGGGVVSVSPYDVLVQLPAELTEASWNRGGAPALAAPSPSPTPTPTPTPSSSAAPPIPGVLEWRKSGRADIGPQVAGVENGVSTIYVCRGYLAGTTPGTVDIVPGKYESSFRFCDVPVRGKEVNDVEYDLLRANPLLTWVPHNMSGGVNGVPASWPGSQSYSAYSARGPNMLPSGATQIMGGNYDGLPAAVCRAYHPEYKSGPHAGFTDGELYGNTPLCFFSWGGKVVRTAPFDYLYMFPVPSPSPSPVSASPSPTPTPTSSKSVSGTPTASVTPSRTGTPSITPSNSGTATPTPTPSSSSYPSTTPSPSRTPSQTPTSSVTPSPTGDAVNAMGSRIPTATPSPSAVVAGAGSGAPPVSAAGVTAIVIAMGCAGVCILGAFRKKKAGGQAQANATGEGDRVRIVTAGV